MTTTEAPSTSQGTKKAAREAETRTRLTALLDAAAPVLAAAAVWAPPTTPPTITVGGAPAGARHVRRRRVAVRGTMPLGPVLPGRTAKSGRDDGTDKPADEDDDRKGNQTSWTSVAHRGALAAVNARRADDREVCVYELDGAWHAIVVDGWGRLIERCTPEPGCEFEDARWLAGATWTALRRAAREHPWRWEIPRQTACERRPAS